MTKTIDRPIVITGTPRSGTTALAAMLNWHPEVGPKHEAMLQHDSAASFLESIMHKPRPYVHLVERNGLWFGAYPGFAVFRRLGQPMYWKTELPEDPETFLSELTENLQQPRLITKSPAHMFRFKAIRKLFPDRRIVVILRRGEQVGASMCVHGTARFAPEHEGVQLDSLEGWRLFAMRWNEAIERIAESAEADTLCISYHDLVRDTPGGLVKVARHCELTESPYIKSLQLNDRTNIWRDRIAPEHHDLVLELFEPGNRIIEELVK